MTRLERYRKVLLEHPAPNETLHLLQFLRFIACIGVLLWHYQHFIVYRGSQYVPNELPFENIFGWFYRNGASGVQVFWCLSGIIFAHVFQRQIAERRISIPQFLWRRFSRLYPLQFVTLLIVALLCLFLRLTTDLTYFIYQFNDWKHFFLNVAFANYWGYQSGFSFNGPVWSVSIELIAYLVFVIVAFSLRFVSNKVRTNLVFLSSWMIVLWVVGNKISSHSDVIATCIALFMVGAITYTVWVTVPNWTTLTIIFYLIVDFTRSGLVHSSLEKLSLSFTSLTIALLISLVALSTSCERYRICTLSANRLGKLTYPMYMLHFPIQFAMVIFSESIYQIDFRNEISFLSFFVLVVVVSLLCHDKFERPVQIKLRSLFPVSHH